MNENHVVVAGNPFDGLELYGPFPTVGDATEWAEDTPYVRRDTWWVMELQPSHIDIEVLFSKDCNHEWTQKVGYNLCVRCGVER